MQPPRPTLRIPRRSASGGLLHSEWRSFKNDRKTVEAHNFVDGDLIEVLLAPLATICDPACNRMHPATCYVCSLQPYVTQAFLELPADKMQEVADNMDVSVWEHGRSNRARSSPCGCPPLQRPTRLRRAAM